MFQHLFIHHLLFSLPPSLLHSLHIPSCCLASEFHEKSLKDGIQVWLHALDASNFISHVLVLNINGWLLLIELNPLLTSFVISGAFNRLLHQYIPIMVAERYLLYFVLFFQTSGILFQLGHLSSVSTFWSFYHSIVMHSFSADFRGVNSSKLGEIPRVISSHKSSVLLTRPPLASHLEALISYEMIVCRQMPLQSIWRCSWVYGNLLVGLSDLKVIPPAPPHVKVSHMGSTVMLIFLIIRCRYLAVICWGLRGRQPFILVLH